MKAPHFRNCGWFKEFRALLARSPLGENFEHGALCVVLGHLQLVSLASGFCFHMRHGTFVARRTIFLLLKFNLLMH